MGKAYKRSNNKSQVSLEVHAWICESLKVKFLWATRLVVTATSRELLEGKVMPLLVEALAKVGLELSIAKTKITHIDDGFDFLGFSVRKYKNGKLLIKPSKAGIKRFLQTVKEIIKKGVALPTEQLIYNLNNRLTG